MKKLILFLISGSFLSACSVASISGYGGSSQFHCQYDGKKNDPRCASISQNYYTSIAGTNHSNNDTPLSNFIAHNPIESGTPIRSQAEIARVWIAPYLDKDGDLVDQSYTYITLSEGNWLLAHNEQRIMDEFRPIRLLGSENQANGQNTNNSNEVKTVMPLKDTLHNNPNRLSD